MPTMPDLHCRLLSLGCSASMFAAAVAIPPPEPSAQIISTEELVAAVNEQQARLDGLTMRVECDNFSTLNADPAFTGAPAPPADVSPHWAATFRYDTVRAGAKYRFDRDIVMAAEGRKDLQPGMHQVIAGDGANYFTVHQDEERELFEVHGTGDTQRPDPTHLDLRGWWVFGHSVRWTFADYISEDQFVVEGPILRPDGQTEWRSHPKVTEQSEFVLTACRRNGHVELTCAEMRVFKSLPKTEETLRMSWTTTFAPIEWDNGQFTPATATNIYRYSGDVPSHSAWAINRIRIVSLERVPFEERTFHLMPRADATVIDGRYKLGYQLGTDLLNVDGRVLRTHVPLYGDVGSRLEWWVENGEFGPIIDPTTGQVVESNRP
jgi:hypothetical protein